MAVSKRKGLGIAPYCLPEKSVSDNVTHAEMQAELARLRAAVVVILDSRLGKELPTIDLRRILDLVAPPQERTGR